MTERRFVDVAVDAPGVRGGQTYTYTVPSALSDIALGEAVMVEFGRRRAVGVLLAHTPASDVEAKPLLARVRSDGPLLDDVGCRLALHVSIHYLAPPAMVVRAMLPPGMLERIELHAELIDSAVAVDTDDVLLTSISAAGAGGLRVDELPAASSRASLLRTLRTLETDGLIALEWRVQPPVARVRHDRWAVLTDTGRDAAHLLAAGERPEGRPLGPKQRTLLAELADDDGDGAAPTARLSERHGASAVNGLAKRGLLDLETRVRERRPLAGRAEPVRGALPIDAVLDEEQRIAVDAIGMAAGAEDGETRSFLLEGDTASGKTAVYAAAIAAARARGRSALVLVPEIALATPLLDRLQHDLGEDVALLHSALSDGERADEWRRINAGDVGIVVGTRMAMLSPPRDLGLIVVDEEHDPAYKSDRTPRYQARDVGLALGELSGSVVVLGSATPDIITIGRVRQGSIGHLRLSGRRSGAHAPVEIADMREELAEGNRGLLSEALASALSGLDTMCGDRAILMINRRGAASVVLCRDCGYVQICPECQRPLVFHASSVSLRCHHCGATAAVARRCPACESVRIKYLGGGTERVVQELGVRFPDLRVGRLDRDVVERKGAAAKVIDDFTSGTMDVLVGTSLVAKGLDVPEVTLVGIISSDIALNLPDERAAERTWQLLTQAVGRAGRGERPGRAILQTYQPDHPAIVAVAERDARAFVDDELMRRERFGSPPFGRLIKLTVALPDREKAIDAARAMATDIRARSDDLGARTVVLGPVPAYIAKRGGRWRFHLVLRGPDPANVLGGDPGQPWSVDVDPESLL